MRAVRKHRDLLTYAREWLHDELYAVRKDMIYADTVPEIEFQRIGSNVGLFGPHDLCL